MAMGRTVYRELAEVISLNLRNTSDETAKKAISEVAVDLAAVCKRDNSNFRFDTFYEACGLDSWGGILDAG